MVSIKWLTPSLLEKIMREAGKRGAPVFKISSFTKRDKFRSLVFTVLSARTKDKTTIKACRKLFAEFRNAEQFAVADGKQIEKLIYGVGFYRTKAKHIVELAKKLNEEFGGEVPADFNSLISLPGVGRKTANVVLALVFGKNAIGVDVHVHRISNRLGIVRTKRPEETEKELVRIIQKNLHRTLNIALVSHGQTTCLPKVPFCSRCVIREYCKRIGVKKSG